MSTATKIKKSKVDILREIALSSFENFIYYIQKDYDGYNPNLYPYQVRIVNKLEEVIAGKITRLNINLPPRYRKTQIAIKYFIAYCLAHNAKAKFIHISYSQKLALDNSEAVKDIILSDAYQLLFPHVQIKKDSKAKEKWYTTEGGGVYATSAGGQVTGFGAGASPEEYEDDEQEAKQAGDLIVEFWDGWNPSEKFGGAILIDDANKPEDADSPTAMNKVNNRYDSTIKNRVNSRNTPIINIQQRIATNDLSAHLQKQGFEDLILQAIDEDGNALCEAIHTIAELRKLENENDIIFASQYQQKPKRAEGLMYQPFVKNESLTVNDLLIGADLLFTSTDANQTTGNDYFSVWFWAIYQGKPFIYDAILERVATLHMKDIFIEMHERNKSQIAVIEQNNQQTFIGEVEKKLKAAVVPVTAKSNKLSRIIAKSHLMAKVGFVWNDNPKYHKAIEHLETFNRDGTHEDKCDDPEDSLTLGLDYLWINYRHIFL
ncbi:hypothetical protein [Chryseobacterium sp. R2A-55]|uniref:hypothetical protein n=1 Tax=Chryseobacterium sp. R2A-55 TaxID=2744445 RepID=UPI001F2FC29C|nr:hypothetical protein [Chryseobacterium sp. R2A-55]